MTAGSDERDRGGTLIGKHDDDFADSFCDIAKTHTPIGVAVRYQWSSSVAYSLRSTHAVKSFLFCGEGIS